MSKERIEQAEKIMGRKLKNPYGSAFDSTGIELAEIGAINWDNDKKTIIEVFSDRFINFKVIHSIIITNWPGEEDNLGASSHIEFFDNERKDEIAYDVLWGMFQSKSIYRKSRLEIHVVEYTLSEWIKNVKDTDRSGPWETQIKIISDKIDNL